MEHALPVTWSPLQDSSTNCEHMNYDECCSMDDVSSETSSETSSLSSEHLYTFSELTPFHVQDCVKSNPSQMIRIDIQGDTVELPVYALRRRNALAPGWIATD